MRNDERREARSGRGGTENGRLSSNDEKPETDKEGNERISDPSRRGNSKGRRMNYYYE
jgi:hypothetical protein